MAGGCGLGALDAAKEKGVQGIGVDADQSYLGPHILTSAEKKVDLAVFDAIKSVQDGHVQGRHRRAHRHQERRRRASARSAPAGQKYAAQVEKVQQQIADGRDHDIPDTVK